MFIRPGDGRATMTGTMKLTALDGANANYFSWPMSLRDVGNTYDVGALNAAIGANDNHRASDMFTKPESGWVSRQALRPLKMGNAFAAVFGTTLARLYQ